MFAKEVYIKRRTKLIETMRSAGESGLLIFIGNIEVPSQGSVDCNGYDFRQDSSWLYYFGIDSPRWAGIIDLDCGETTLYADDFSLDDIIWMGPQMSVQDQANLVGITKSSHYKDWDKCIHKALLQGRHIHFLPPLRFFNLFRICEATGFPYGELKTVKPGNGPHASETFVKAVVSQRLVKEECEIHELDLASDLGYQMHVAGRLAIRPGGNENNICSAMDELAKRKGWGRSFATIVSQHGETLHNINHYRTIESGNLIVVDAGIESFTHYASDHTRTYPTSGKFTSQQRDVYQIVSDCNEYAFSLIRPNISYRDVHIATSKKMLDGLAGLGLVRGNLEEMVELGVAGLFQPHGLGHNMGLDAHDMEDLGEDYVGYDSNQTRSEQLGLGSLRMARILVPGNVITDEPGIYFIPALIEKYRQSGLWNEYVNYEKLEKYYCFGGIRLEDDILVTDEGARRLGTCRLPIYPDDVESAMSINTGLHKSKDPLELISHMHV